MATELHLKLQCEIRLPTTASESIGSEEPQMIEITVQVVILVVKVSLIATHDKSLGGSMSSIHVAKNNIPCIDGQIFHASS